MLTHFITQAAIKMGVSAYLLLSICTVETKLRYVNSPNDRNGGSWGVCQLNLRTARELYPYIDAIALQNPRTNALVAAQYLRILSEKHSGNRLIGAYNMGSVRYDDNGNIVNMGYINKVNHTMKRIKVND